MALLAGVAAVAVTAGVRVPIAVAVVAGLAVADWLVAGGPWRVSIGRDLPGVVTVGQQARVQWCLRGTRSWPQRVELADELPPSLGAPRRVATTITDRRTTTVTMSCAPTRRGRHRPSALAVRLSGPLRLVARQHTRQLPGRIDVHPAFPSRRDAQLRVTDRRMLENGTRSLRSLGRGTEFESLREYTLDDQVRRIDWSATARAGKPIVRTYRAERNQTVQVLVDTGRLSAGLVGGTAHLDHLMDAVLALATVAIGVGDQVGLTAFADDVRAEVPAGRGHDHRGRIGTALAPLQPRLVESDYRAAFTSLVARQRRRGLLVVLTDLSSDALVDTLVPALPVLLSRHLVIIGAVDDPQVGHWVTRPGTGVDDAWLAAGAATLLRTRHRTAHLLRQRGALVVDQPPSRLPTRLMDTYLDVKAEGRL